ncbi:MAG: T9SS type A sorting domain-containing protein [Bacteroidetes bacterium]|nr:T9SS type A sorting domain-containing protein [Bacteroidota bacterium]
MKTQSLFACVVLFVFSLNLSAQQGLLDKEFGVDGIVLHSYDTTFQYFDAAHKILVQPDGKIITAGYHSTSKMAFSRFKADGKLDETFGNHGATLIPYAWSAGDNVRDFAMQSDGKILALIESYHFNPDFPDEWGNAYIMRFKPNGELDETFGHTTPYGEHGATIIPTGYDVTNVGQMALLPDGKIMVTGMMKNEFYNYMDAFVMRFDTAGNIDTDFANNGLAKLKLEYYGYEIINLFFQQDGKIIIAGNGQSYINGSQHVLYLFRILPDGTPDLTYGSGGAFTTNLPTQYGLLRQFTMKDDGSIMAWSSKGINQSADLDIIKIQPNGGIDTTFATDGVFTLDTHVKMPTITKISVDEDGGYYLAGYKLDSMKYQNDFALAKLTHDFNWVDTFGTHGVTITNITDSTDDVVNDAALLPNHKILLAGYASPTYYRAKLTLAQFYGRDTIPIDMPQDTMSPPETDTLLLDENGLNIRPNPVLENFAICYELSEKSIISIELYNSAGQLIHIFTHEKVQDAGAYCRQFHWPDDIEKGVYFIKLYGRHFAYTGKVLKL